MLWQARQGLVAGRGALDAAPAGGGGDAAQTTAFLARADASTVVGAPERAAYTALINGLVSDGVFAKLDALYVFATDTQTHALLNLVSSSFTASLVSTPTFTADRGFTGNGSTTAINSNYASATAGGLFTLNSCHLSAWSNTAGEGDNSIAGAEYSTNSKTSIYPKYSGGDCYMRLNDASNSAPISTVPTGAGFYTAVRTSSSVREGYWNGASIGNAASTATGALSANSFYFCGANTLDWSTRQISGGSIGGGLTTGEAGSLYTRLRAYMTAVGVS